MTNLPLVSLQRRFAFTAAWLAGIAMLAIAGTSWWLIGQEHAASVRSLVKKEAELQSASVSSRLHALATRMSELTGNNLIADALVDDTTNRRYLVPYLNGIKRIQDVPVDILFTDFKGHEIASNGSGTFTGQELGWLKEKLAAGRPAAIVLPVATSETSQELLAVEFVVFSRSHSAEGALLYKVRLNDLPLQKNVRLVQGTDTAQWLRSQTAMAVAVDVPLIYKNLDFAVLTSTEPTARGSDWRSLGFFFILSGSLVLAVLLLGLSIGKLLTRDLLKLQLFAQDISEKGFGAGRAEAADSLEVAGLARSINRMLERLTQQHHKLSESEERFRTLFEYSDLGMNVCNTDSRYMAVNPAFARMTGYSQEALLGMNFNDITHPDYIEPGLARMQTLLTGQADHFHMEKKFIRKDGCILWADVSVSAVRDEAVLLMSFIGVTQDITGRKRAEGDILRLNASLEERVQRRTAQLQASNRDLEEFAYSVAHDLRQPFIAIGGFSDLLGRTVKDERAMHYIERIKAGVRQADELTDSLLALANLSRVQLHLQPVDLSAVAHSVMDALQRDSPARLASVSIQSGLVVHADPVLIRQMLQALLDNAWKFTSRRSHTGISFGLVPPQADAVGAVPVYVVRDNGEGFDMAQADKLFRSFQRLHTAQEFPGAGAALVKVQRIAERHHGQVWAESAPGEGARFFFTLGSDRPDGEALSGSSRY